VTTALYRRYRPETFAQVIGQEHVTEPLAQALRGDRVSHAYLFSGPRGCGKTTSARILARCLNCAEGPTPDPCGVCDSCVELARSGSGSLDVVEIDAASHNGVDDARDLRERAAYAPARDRYKIFILDEAHMVTPQGFNALLKIVEEPPQHVKFVFATTEPDKVIGTIRSRTHHYPFRLVAPDTLQPYLEQICASEGVTVGPGVLPLVVRAGGGSVRDSLSVLDQLVAGAGKEGIDYESAVALLGYTHASLLDDAVEAIAARDGASAFRVVDRVVATGHEPRRFVEDLLERLRDLIVIAASGDSADAVLRTLPTDQVARMRTQAASLGAAELSRSADLANAALTEMTGATSPRLHLELLAARLLLPAADDGARGLGARLDRVERVLGAGASGASGGPDPGPPPLGAPDGRPVSPAPAAPSMPEPSPDGPSDRRPGTSPSEPKTSPKAEPAQPAPSEPKPTPKTKPAGPTPSEPAPASTASPASPAGPGMDAEVVRRRWPEVLQTLRTLRVTTWALVSQNAQVSDVSATTVTLAFTTPQLATTFRTGPHPANVQRALHETLGLDARVEATIATGATTASPRGKSADESADPADPEPAEYVVGASAQRAAASWDAPLETPVDDPEPGVQAPPAATKPARPARRRPAGAPAAAAAAVADADPSEEASPDDPELAESGMVGEPLIAQMLGGTVIDEVTEDD
jgi:DNA polymerase-3 subunit gamma/tau